MNPEPITLTAAQREDFARRLEKWRERYAELTRDVERLPPAQAAHRLRMAAEVMALIEKLEVLLRMRPLTTEAREALLRPLARDLRSQPLEGQMR